MLTASMPARREDHIRSKKPDTTSFYRAYEPYLSPSGLGNTRISCSGFCPDTCVFEETQRRNAGPLIIFHRYWPSSMDIESRSIWVTDFGILCTSPFKHGQNHLVAMFVLRILLIAFPNIAIFMWRLTANSASDYWKTEHIAKIARNKKARSIQAGFWK